MSNHARQAESSWEDSYRRQRPAQPDGGYYDVSRYSRDAYSTGRGRSRRRGVRSGGWAKRILIAVVAIIALVIVSSTAYGMVFDSKTHGNLSTPDTLSQALTPTSGDEPYYILLLGSDWRENSGTSSAPEMSGDQQRADVIILARMDAANKQVTLVSVPRDTRWYHDGTVSKINEAYNIGGAALETQVISELTGVPIAHTIETHFSGLEALVDALGGVEVDVPQTIEYKDALTGEKVKVEAGRQVLNGQAAQIFARVRKAYTDQDAARQGNVRTLVLAIAESIRSKPFFELPGLGLKVADCLGTDMGALDFLKLARDFGHGGMTLYSGSGPTAGEVDDSAGGLWLCYENPDGWKAVMDVVNAGGDPSSVNANEYLNQQADAYYPYDEYGNYIGEYYEESDYGYYGVERYDYSE